LVELLFCCCFLLVYASKFGGERRREEGGERGREREGERLFCFLPSFRIACRVLSLSSSIGGEEEEEEEELRGGGEPSFCSLASEGRNDDMVKQLLQVYLLLSKRCSATYDDDLARKVGSVGGGSAGVMTSSVEVEAWCVKFGKG
jgi:hypothetical protein